MLFRSEKILDCDGEPMCSRARNSLLSPFSERIRNTLSHEMCHLACWIINEAPNENHGSLFKRWCRPVFPQGLLIVC